MLCAHSATVNWILLQSHGTPNRPQHFDVTEFNENRIKTLLPSRMCSLLVDWCDGNFPDTSRNKSQRISGSYFPSSQLICLIHLRFRLMNRLLNRWTRGSSPLLFFLFFSQLILTLLLFFTIQ